MTATARHTVDDYEVTHGYDAVLVLCPCGWVHTHDYLVADAGNLTIGELRRLGREHHAVHVREWERADTIERLRAADPLHLHVEPGDRDSICGLRNPLPAGWWHWVGSWRRSRVERDFPPLVLCPACETGALARGLDLDGPAPAPG